MTLKLQSNYSKTLSDLCNKTFLQVFSLTTISKVNIWTIYSIVLKWYNNILAPIKYMSDSMNI